VSLILSTFGEITFGTNLKIISGGDAIILQNTQVNERSILQVMPKGTIGIPAALEFFGTDFIADGTNYERLQIYAGTTYNISTYSAGTGTLRPLCLYTEGNANQLLLAIDGGIFMSTLKSGANQGAAGAAAGELWRDTADNSVKLGV